MNHEAITAIVAPNGYGVGVKPNPFSERQPEWKRRREHKKVLDAITEKIDMLFEPRFITPPETAECIAAIATMTDSRRILELGMCTGFTTLHLLRALYGKPGARLVSVDHRPAHDRTFFDRKEFSTLFRHVDTKTPEAFEQLKGEEPFDLVFIDSDHSLEHTRLEVDGLLPITKPGSIWVFHDMPAWQKPNNPTPPPVRLWLMTQSWNLKGFFLPSCEQMDCLEEWGPGYPKECNPGLGVFVRP